MLLLAAAAGWLVLTRPVHRIEGDFLRREDRSVADDWLLDQLRNPIAEIRGRAYLALGRIQGRSAAGLLMQGMADPAPSVRAAAAFAAGNAFDAGLEGASPEAPVAAALAALLADDERLPVTRAVAALGKMGSLEAVPAIVGSAAPVATSMTALMRMEAAAAKDFVREYLDSDDQDSRWAAALAAGRLRLAGRQRDAALPAAEPALERPPPSAVRGPLLKGQDYQRVAKTIGARLRMSTSLGDFDIELDYERAPLTSEHFRRLAGQGAFDGTRFFAVRPNGYGAAAPGMHLIRPELNPEPFLRGSLGLLRYGGAAGGGFFLCTTALPLADGRYVNFGRLVSGDRRLDSIQAGTSVHSIRELP